MSRRGELVQRSKAYDITRVGRAEMSSANARHALAKFGDTGRQAQSVALVAVAALAGIALVGTWGAVLFIAAALALCALEPVEAGRTFMRFLPLLLIPLLALASTLWSDAPQRTARAAIQLLLTMVAAILVARRMDERSMIVVLFWGFLGICLLAAPGIPGSLAGGGPVVAPFESKNQVGFASHFLFALALAVLFGDREWLVARLAAAAAIPFSLLLAWLSQSAGAQTSFGLTLLLFPALVVFGRIPIAWRVGALILIFALVAVCLAFLPAIEAAIVDFRGNVLKKDATLTGRTYLWEFADRISTQKPLLGHGYYAFWRHGNIDAEGLWRWAGIGSRSGFNFHNAFVEMRVDLGLVGLTIMVITCAAIALAAAWRHVTQPSSALAFFIAMIAVFYGRSLGESGLIAPFSLTMALWVAGGVYAFSGRKRVGSTGEPLRIPHELPMRARYIRVRRRA